MDSISTLKWRTGFLAGARVAMVVVAIPLSAYGRCDVSDVSELAGRDLSGCDLQGADLSLANLKNTNLEGANLEGAINLPDLTAKQREEACLSDCG